MTSTRERQQRAAARARLAQQMAERREAARKRRQTQAAVGAGVALLLIAGGVFWAVTAFSGDDDGPPAAAAAPEPTGEPVPGECVWNEVPPDQVTDQVVDVGLPPAGVAPQSGTQVMTVATSFGAVEVTMDLAQSPCTAASFTHLAEQEFFDGTKCHRMFPGMLQCGDPTAKGDGYRETDGRGGPSYRFPDENLPVAETPPYPAGVVAMANSGPDTNGSQFFFIYEDVQLSPDYSVVGTVTSGMDVLAEATEAGHDGAFDPSPGGGHPTNDIVIETLRVSPAEA